MTRLRKTAFLTGLAASGWHTGAIMMRLLVQGGLPIAGGIIGAGGELSWMQPTRPGDVLRVESEVLAIAPSKSRPERGMATVRSETKNQRDEIVQVFTMRIVVYKEESKNEQHSIYDIIHRAEGRSHTALVQREKELRPGDQRPGAANSVRSIRKRPWRPKRTLKAR